MIDYSNNDIETTLLASAWLNHNFDCISDLKQDDFYYKNNRDFFNIMVKMYIEKVEYNVSNFALFQTKDCDNKYIANIMTNCNTVRDNTLLKNEFKELSKKRKYLQSLKETEAMIKDKCSADEIYSHIESFNRNIAIDETEQRESFVDVANYDFDKFILPPGAPMSYLKDVDDKTMGFLGGQLTTIAARPGDGKTTLALNIASNNARAGNNVSIFSLEMVSVEIYIKELSRQMRTDSMILDYQLKFNKVTEKLKPHIIAGKERILKYAIHMNVYDTIFNIDSICKQIRKDSDYRGTKLFIIDYVQLIETNITGKPNEKISYCTRKLKQLAQTLDVSIVILSQLNRNSTTREYPELSDLKASGSIEEDSNKVLFMFQSDEKKKIGSDEYLIIIAKNRGGSVGNVPVVYKKAIHDIACIDYRNVETYKA